MRTVSFVHRIEADFHGTIFHEALVVGDVDNDSFGELAVGNTSGDLAIFKGNGSKAWKKAHGLGMITCMSIGDVRKTGKNSLLVMTAEAQCHLFEIQPQSTNKAPGGESDDTMSPVYTETVPANSKGMIITGSGEGGEIDVIVAYSDRVVRAFRWVNSSDTTLPIGQLQQREKWQLAGQVGSLTTNRCHDGSMELMASQPGGTFVTLLPANERNWDDVKDANETLDYNVPALIYHPLSLSSRTRSSSVTTEMVGCLGWREGRSLYALTTLDGTIMLVDDDAIVWSMQVDHQLFSLNRLDVTGDGQEELVTCAWDGQTYIIDHNQDVAKYHFTENVAAFACGMYGANEAKNEPCFVYTTFDDKLYIYHDLNLSYIRPLSLHQFASSQTHTKTLADSLGKTKMAEVYRWCLYSGSGEG